MDPNPINGASSDPSPAAAAVPPALKQNKLPAASGSIMIPLPSPTSSTTGKASPPPQQIADTLKCPICLDWFNDPILLDCSHSLCLGCARSLALHDGGSNTAEIVCPLCKEVTAVSGGDKAKELEDALIAAALKRFDVHPPRKNRVRIEDLKICYEAYAKNGLVSLGDEPKPTALHIWRAVVAKMESQTQELLGEKKEGGGAVLAEAGGDGVPQPVLSQETPEGGSYVSNNSSSAENEDSQSSSTKEAPPSLSSSTSEIVTVEDPMHKLRFKRNILLNNLVTHFKEQQLAGEDLRPSLLIAQSSSLPLQAAASPSNGTPFTKDPPPALDFSLGLAIEEEEGELPERTPSGASPLARKVLTPDPTLEDLPPADEPPAAVAAAGGGAAARGGKVPTNPTVSRHIWVGNLGQGVKEEHLREAFHPFGVLESVRLLRRSTMNMVAFLHFHRTEDAIQAKQKMNGNYLRAPGASGPHPMKVQYQARGGNPPCPILRIHNISPKATDNDLRQVLDRFGRIRTVSMNGRTHIVFITFENTEAATACVNALHDTVIMDRHVFIDYSPKDTEGGSSGGGNRGPVPTGRGGGERDTERGGGGGSRDRDRDRRSPPRRGPSPSGYRGGRDRPPPPPRDGGGRGRPPPPGAKIMLPSPRGCPPFEVYPEEVERLREMVDLMQFHSPPHQRKSLEDALQNRELHDHITLLLGRNRRDLDSVINELRIELNIPPPDFRGPPPPFDHHHHPHHPPRDGAYGKRGPPPLDRDFNPPPPDDFHRGGGGPPPPYPPSDGIPYLPRSGGGGGPRGGGGPPPPPGWDDRGRDEDRYRGGGGRPRDGPPLPPPPHYRGDNRGPPPEGYPPPMDDPRGVLPPPPGDRRRGPEGPPPPQRGGGGIPSRGGRSPPRVGRSRSPGQQGGGGGFRGKRGRDGGRSRSPPSRRRRGDDRPPQGGPPGGRERGRDAYPPRSRSPSGQSGDGRLPPADYYHHHRRGEERGGPPAGPPLPPPPHHGGRPGGNGPPPPLPPHPQQQQQHRPPMPAGTAGPPPPPPFRPRPSQPGGVPLEAECEEFLQAVMGPGGGGGAIMGGAPPLPPGPPLPPAGPFPYGHGGPPGLPPLPPGPPPSSSEDQRSGPPPPRSPPPGPPRIWLTSASAATYPCYEGVLELVKNLLTPYYRSQAISKEDFKRIAEDSTLLLVQQLLEHRLENRPDVPAHYHNVAADLIRGALPPSR